jgi:hypothetical protein
MYNMPDLSNKNLILIELNELNFDIVDKYIEQDRSQFPGFCKLFELERRRLKSEISYEHLEPWIQWVSIHTGLSYTDHEVFRLGDIVNSKHQQIFEELEGAGFNVGSISAMNAENRLNKPAYFIPDPWTNTKSDPSWLSCWLSNAISQAVNDNASKKLSISTVLILFISFLRFANIKNMYKYIYLATSSGKFPWRKALFLDLFLYDIHDKLFRKSRPNFSTLFLNAGAHIQHHYFLNSDIIKKATRNRNPKWYLSANKDPIRETLLVYDSLIEDILDLKNVDLILATGLTQVPYDRIKYYYRLNNHADFLNKISVNFSSVEPRMTRDFVVYFMSENSALDAEKILKNINIKQNSKALFGEIDNRGLSLFITLTYPEEITNDTIIMVGEKELLLSPEVSFVALKNGMHHGDCFCFFTKGTHNFIPNNGDHVKNLHSTIKKYFLK